MMHEKAKMRGKVADCVSNMKAPASASKHAPVMGAQGHATPSAMAHTGKRYFIKVR